MDKSVSIVLPVHNQEFLIHHVVRGIVDNASENVREFIIIIDGCTDNSEAVIKNALINKPDWMDVIYLYEPDVFELKSCNAGFKKSTCAFSLNVQDDMVVVEKDFDIRLMKPFFHVDNLMAVTARDAVNGTIDPNGNISYYDVSGRDVNSPRNMFYIRDAINRGPVLFKNSILQEMNYLDEAFCPQDGDDVDLCFRAYKEKGYVAGAYMMDYLSEPHWGKTRNNAKSNAIWAAASKKNLRLLAERHRDALLGKKHNQDIPLE